jgi:hypothetical protein
MKFSWAISQVKWLNGEKTNILKTLSVLILHISTLRTRTAMVFETLVFFTVQPLDPADSLREFYYTQLPGKQQILHHLVLFE